MNSESTTEVDVNVIIENLQTEVGNLAHGRCRNSCELDDENKLNHDGFCDGCHEYPEG